MVREEEEEKQQLKRIRESSSVHSENHQGKLFPVNRASHPAIQQSRATARQELKDLCCSVYFALFLFSLCHRRLFDVLWQLDWGTTVSVNIVTALNGCLLLENRRIQIFMPNQNHHPQPPPSSTTHLNDLRMSFCCTFTTLPPTLSSTNTSPFARRSRQAVSPIYSPTAVAVVVAVGIAEKQEVNKFEHGIVAAFRTVYTGTQQSCGW